MPLPLCVRIALLLTPLIPTQAHAMRCNSRLISIGDTALTLEHKCGPADFVTTQRIANTTAAVGTALAGATTRTFETIETRIYRGDPGRMATFVEVRRGIVTAMRRVHIATVDDPTQCQRVLEASDTLGKVRLACGSPLDTTQWSEERVVTVNGLEQREAVTYDRWFYDLGPGRFERVLTFENGRLIAVEAGRRQ